MNKNRHSVLYIRLMKEKASYDFFFFTFCLQWHYCLSVMVICFSWDLLSNHKQKDSIAPLCLAYLQIFSYIWFMNTASPPYMLHYNHYCIYFVPSIIVSYSTSPPLEMFHYNQRNFFSLEKKGRCTINEKNKTRAGYAENTEGLSSEYEYVRSHNNLFVFSAYHKQLIITAHFTAFMNSGVGERKKYIYT